MRKFPATGSPGFRGSSPVGDPWNLGFAIIHRASAAVIGGCGFKGPPGPDGTVEIAYGIDPAEQGKGYATEAAAALTTYALADARVRLVRAHTFQKANASARVLTKCGFHPVAQVLHPEDGPVWRWETLRESTPEPSTPPSPLS